MEESESQTSCVPLSPVELLCDLIIELEEPVEDRSEKVLEIPLWVDERTLADRLNLVQKCGALLEEATSIP